MFVVCCAVAKMLILAYTFDLVFMLGGEQVGSL
jgi:hypothetical protein